MRRVIIRIVLLAIIIVCAILIVRDVYEERRELQRSEDLALALELPAEPSDEETKDSSAGDDYVPVNLSKNRKNINFPQLIDRNNNSIGWIYIPNTTINHPVVLGETNETYLNINIDGSPSIYGTIFADCNNTFKPMDTNIVLYGHNMGSGKTAMFSQLINFSDQSYFEKRRILQFDTIYGIGNWEVFAAFEIDIGKDNGGFNYAQRNFDNKDDFGRYVDKVKSLSLITSKTPVKYGDKILTLSTCHRHFLNSNNRFVVLAVLREGSLMD